MSACRTSPPGTTWFLRDQAEIDALVAALQRDHAASRPLRIWSAGCSTGQEPYGLVMALLSAGLSPHVLATDVRPEALAVASAARYSTRVISVLPAAWRQRYVTALSDDEVILRPAVTSRVQFYEHDIASTHDLPFGWGPFDAVVCRNVLIYFDRSDAIAIATRLATACRPGGYLLLSAAERPLAWPSALVRPDDDFQDSALLRRVLTPSTEPRPPRTVKESVRPPATVQDLVPPALAPPEAGDRELAQASALVHQGDFAAAQGLVDKVLARDPLSAPAHLLRGLSLKQAGQLHEAAAALRRSRLLFDNEAWLPPYQLAILLEQLGQPREAAEAYRHTLAVIRSGARSGIPGEGHEDTLLTTVAETCQARLQRLAGQGLL
ncbi:MAG: methyltransferase domain-containing protein [Myxococcales bacterium]|nr:methyltransferase domain-containing protein [Myxococcales bacterium]